MRLSPDCLRDILLCVESNCNLRENCIFIDKEYFNLSPRNLIMPEYQIQLLWKYDNDKLIYHIRYCIDADLISEIPTSKSYEYKIKDLTPAGHQFVSKVRDDNNWGMIKKGLSSVRDYSLSAISAIADGVTSAMIQSYFSSH